MLSVFNIITSTKEVMFYLSDCLLAVDFLKNFALGNETDRLIRFQA